MLGDGERIIQEVTLLYRDWKREGKPGGRLGFLRRVSRIQESTSLPSMKSPTGRTDHHREETSGAHGTGSGVQTGGAGSGRLDFPTHPIVPYSDTVHDRIMLELFRGCSRGCRFCNAGSSTGRSGNGNRKR